MVSDLLDYDSDDDVFGGLADEMVAGRIAGNTKKQYLLCLKRIQKHTTTNDFGQLSFSDNPPTIDFVRSYHGKFTTGKKTGAGVCSTSTTGMVSSVLKYFFEENGKRMPDDISTFIKRVTSVR